MKLIEMLFMVLVLSLSLSAMAEDHGGGGHGESGGHEEKKDAHGSGDKGEHGGEAQAPSKSMEWVKLNTVLTTLAAKVTSLQADVKELIKKKKTIKDRAQLEMIWEEINTKHKELDESVRQYQKESNRARFEFPDKGSIIQKKYHYVRMKSIDELENEVGIEAKLTHSVDQVQRVYRGVPKNKPTPTPTPEGYVPSPTPDRIKVRF